MSRILLSYVKNFSHNHQTFKWVILSWYDVAIDKLHLNCTLMFITFIKFVHERNSDKMLIIVSRETF